MQAALENAAVRASDDEPVAVVDLACQIMADDTAPLRGSPETPPIPERFSDLLCVAFYLNQ
ncbi:hypothetical protein ABT404_03470 [Streptomyces hyaluromycini]|uniref:Uncharacterized protein n=1 Tax=Streptomyces hyaluromycini TaxID=1377993 RepID=A0ABV1WNU5_9ACTN